jgi:two-component system chemotaxis sensor kinase CheA
VTVTIPSDRSLLEVFLEEARGLLRRASADRSAAIARELAELAGVIGDAELVDLCAGLRTALERGFDPGPSSRLVERKLAAIAAPPPPPSSWDPAELGEMRGLFLVEARSTLSAIEDALATLRTDPGSQPAFDALFRKLHTLKGSAGSVELHALSAAAHRLEDVMEAGRGERGPAVIEAVAAGLPELRRLIGGAPPAAESGAGELRPAAQRGAAPLDALRVDELLDAASELVLDRTRIERRLRAVEEIAGAASAELRGQLGELGADVATLGRTIRRLGERLRRLRATELGVMARRLEPVVRSIARREHKQVRLLVRGATEEIDQRLAEALAEPLLHLVRNAVVHGVESPADRIVGGKPAQATVTLSLRQTGDGLELEVADDGGGVNLGALRSALIHAERLTAEEAAALPVDALLATLFQPGISTRLHADELAGRGVGLDAVADAIARLGGDVAVASTPGVGCRFTIRVPVESRVLEAVLFKVGDQVFAVPSARVDEVLEIDKDLLLREPGPDRLRIGEDTLPVVRLGALLLLPPPPGIGDRRSALVLLSRGQRFAITCDRVIGPREIVVRRLPPALIGLRPWAGATISGAGKVQLIFDVDALAQAARGASPAARPAQPAGPRRVLVIDEARSTRDAAALILEHAGFDVERASDGWDALERLGDRPFDLLLCRLEQEGLPGAALIARAHESPHLRSVPILILSDLDEHAARAVLGDAAGAVAAVITLPLRRRPLLDSITAALR